MSFNTLRAYFETRMAVTDPDLHEWEDAFGVDNIPSGILDHSWHIEFGPFNYVGTAHTCLEFNCPVSLRVYLKGYRYPKEAIDSGMILADAIVKECCKPLNRLNQPYIKNVLPNTIDVRALGQTNDNAVVLSLSFDCNVLVES